jgi:hypothetical protein
LGKICNMSNVDSDDSVKVTVNLPEFVVKELRQMATEKNVSMTELIAQSIRLNKFLSDRERQGGKILVENADRKIERIVRK